MLPGAYQEPGSVPRRFHYCILTPWELWPLSKRPDAQCRCLGKLIAFNFSDFDMKHKGASFLPLDEQNTFRRPEEQTETCL